MTVKICASSLCQNTFYPHGKGKVTKLYCSKHCCNHVAYQEHKKHRDLRKEEFLKRRPIKQQEFNLRFLELVKKTSIQNQF